MGTLLFLFTPRDHAAWPSPELLVMTIVGIVLLLSSDRILRLKAGTTVIAGITTIMSVAVMLSPFINEFPNGRPIDSSGGTALILLMSLFGFCVLYTIRKLRSRQ